MARRRKKLTGNHLQHSTVSSYPKLGEAKTGKAWNEKWPQVTFRKADIKP